MVEVKWTPGPGPCTRFGAEALTFESWRRIDVFEAKANLVLNEMPVSVDNLWRCSRRENHFDYVCTQFIEGSLIWRERFHKRESERASDELLRAFLSFQNLDSDAESELHVNVMKRTYIHFINHPRVIEEIRGAEMEGKLKNLKEVLLSWLCSSLLFSEASSMDDYLLIVTNRSCY